MVGSGITPDHCCYGRLDGRTMRPPEYGGIEVVPVRADGRDVSVAAVYCGVAVVVSTTLLVETSSAVSSQQSVFSLGICLCHRADGGSDTWNQPVSGLEQPVGIACVYGGNRTVDAGAGRGGNGVDGTVLERARRRAIVGEYRFDGVITRHGGRVNVPRRRAVVYFAQTCGGMGDGDIVLGDTYAVLRFCATDVVGCVVRLCVSVDRQFVGAHCDAFYQQCDYSGGVLGNF